MQLVDTKLFKKGSEPQYTSEVYKVESVHGKTIYLEGGLKKKCNMLLKVHKDTIGSSHTITQKGTKEKAIDRN